MVKITINDNVTKLKEKSKAKNTRDKYNGDWLKFINYCKKKYKCDPLDVDDLGLCLCTYGKLYGLVA